MPRQMGACDPALTGKEAWCARVEARLSVVPLRREADWDGRERFRRSSLFPGCLDAAAVVALLLAVLSLDICLRAGNPPSLSAVPLRVSSSSGSAYVR
jgi:hypothetical protein